MSTNPPSFRLPFALKTEFSDDVHPEVQEALKALAGAVRYAFTGLVDVNQSIPVILGKIPAATAPATTTPAAGNVIGSTNNQTGQASYEVKDSDYGSTVIVSHAASVAVSLASPRNTPFFTRIKVDSGSGAAKITPAIGTVNGAGFILVSAGTTVQLNLKSDDNNWLAS